MLPTDILPVFEIFGLGFFLANTAVGTLILWLGYAQIAAYFVLSLLYEGKHKKRIREPVNPPKVSVLISAYNEEKVIGNCVESVLKSNYSPMEVIVVDDGSTDRTPEVLDLLSATRGITVFHQANGGKAAALNFAVRKATGSLIVTMDADTVIQSDAITKMARHFTKNKVGAVCGYDIPSNPNNWLVKVLMLSAHVSTGFVRRALDTVDCVMVVNFGMFRKNILEEVGLFADTIGEDFEITLKIHERGYRIDFESDALGYSESPMTLGVLWHQRIRWFRGYLHGIRLHKGMLFRHKFGVFLAYNFFTNILFPWFLFIAGLMFSAAHIAAAVNSGEVGIENELYLTISFFGLAPSFIVVCYSLFLDRHLGRYAPLLIFFPLWIPYSIFLDLVCMAALGMEVMGTERKWRHWTKTGVIVKE